MTRTQKIKETCLIATLATLLAVAITAIGTLIVYLFLAPIASANPPTQQNSPTTNVALDLRPEKLENLPTPIQAMIRRMKEVNAIGAFYFSYDDRKNVKQIRYYLVYISKHSLYSYSMLYGEEYKYISRKGALQSLWKVLRKDIPGEVKKVASIPSGDAVKEIPLEVIERYLKMEATVRYIVTDIAGFYILNHQQYAYTVFYDGAKFLVFRCTDRDPIIVESSLIRILDKLANVLNRKK